jgi:hypothetical protein
LFRNHPYIQGPVSLLHDAVNQCHPFGCEHAESYAVWPYHDVPIHLQAVDAEELQPLDTLAGRHVLVAVAAFFGSVRLIDNIVLEPT